MNNEPLARQTLIVEYIRPVKWFERVKFKLAAPLRFQGLIVPVGFVSDMGTIPRLFWWLFDPFNRYAHATVIHDYALTQLERSQADKLFKAALEELQVKRWRIAVLYLAVRLYSRLKSIRKPT